MSVVADRRYLTVLALVFVMAALVLLPGLGNHDLWAPDEPRYAQVSREMVEGGDWLLPRVNDRIYTDKPPGYFWLVGLASWPAGAVTATSARLPSAVIGILVLLLVAWWGERRLGQGIGFPAAMVLVTTFLFFDLGRSAHLDMLMALLVTVALFSAAAIFFAGGGAGHRLLFWLAAALAVLVKGPVGLLLPLLVVTVDRLAARSPRDLLRLQPWWGLPLAAAVPVAWLMAVAAGHAGYEPATVIQRHVLSRFGSGLHHARPFWYYGVHFFTELAPWSFVVPAAAVAAWRFRSSAGERQGEETVLSQGVSRRRFLVVWVLTIVLFFSISTEKRGLYIMPVTPAAALLVADLWHRLRHGSLQPSRLLYAGVGVPSCLLALLMALPWVLASRSVDGASAVAGLIPMIAAAGGVTGLATLAALARRRLPLALATLTAGTLLLLLTYAHAVQPAMDPVKSSRAMGEAIAAEVRPGDLVGMNHWRASYLYYSGVNMVELAGEDGTIAWMKEPGGRRLLLLREREWQGMQPQLPGVRVLLALGEGSRRRVLLERPAQPDAQPTVR